MASYEGSGHPYKFYPVVGAPHWKVTEKWLLADGSAIDGLPDVETYVAHEQAYTLKTADALPDVFANYTLIESSKTQSELNSISGHTEIVHTLKVTPVFSTGEATADQLGGATVGTAAEGVNVALSLVVAGESKTIILPIASNAGDHGLPTVEGDGVTAEINGDNLVITVAPETSGNFTITVSTDDSTLWTATLGVTVSELYLAQKAANTTLDQWAQIPALFGANQEFAEQRTAITGATTVADVNTALVAAAALANGKVVEFQNANTTTAYLGDAVNNTSLTASNNYATTTVRGWILEQVENERYFYLKNFATGHYIGKQTGSGNGVPVLNPKAENYNANARAKFGIEKDNDAAANRVLIDILDVSTNASGASNPRYVHYNSNVVIWGSGTVASHWFVAELTLPTSVSLSPETSTVAVDAEGEDRNVVLTATLEPEEGISMGFDAVTVSYGEGEDIITLTRNDEGKFVFETQANLTPDDIEYTVTAATVNGYTASATITAEGASTLTVTEQTEVPSFQVGVDETMRVAVAISANFGEINPDNLRASFADADSETTAEVPTASFATKDNIIYMVLTKQVAGNWIATISYVDDEDNPIATAATRVRVNITPKMTLAFAETPAPEPFEVNTQEDAQPMTFTAKVTVDNAIDGFNAQNFQAKVALGENQTLADGVKLPEAEVTATTGDSSSEYVLNVTITGATDANAASYVVTLRYGDTDAYVISPAINVTIVKESLKKISGALAGEAPEFIVGHTDAWTFDVTLTTTPAGIPLTLNDLHPTLTSTTDATTTIPGVTIAVKDASTGTYTVTVPNTTTAADTYSLTFANYGEIPVTFENTVTVTIEQPKVKSIAVTTDLSEDKTLNIDETLTINGTISPAYAKYNADDFNIDVDNTTIQAGTFSVNEGDNGALTWSVTLTAKAATESAQTLTISYGEDIEASNKVTISVKPNAKAETASITLDVEKIVAGETTFIPTANSGVTNTDVTASIKSVIADPADAITDNGDGSYIAVKPGSVTIKATITNPGKEPFEIQKTVTIEQPEVKSIAVTTDLSEDKTLNIDETLTINGTISPAYAKYDADDFTIDVDNTTIQAGTFSVNEGDNGALTWSVTLTAKAATESAQTLTISYGEDIEASNKVTVSVKPNATADKVRIEIEGVEDKATVEDVVGMPEVVMEVVNDDITVSDVTITPADAFVDNGDGTMTAAKDYETVTFSVTVTNPNGPSFTVTKTITVAPRDPAVDIILPTPTEGEEPEVEILTPDQLDGKEVGYEPAVLIDLKADEDDEVEGKHIHVVILHEVEATVAFATRNVNLDETRSLTVKSTNEDIATGELTDGKIVIKRTGAIGTTILTVVYDDATPVGRSAADEAEASETALQTIHVEVKLADKAKPEITGVADASSVTVGRNIQLSPKAMSGEKEVANATFSYTSSDMTTATVDENGRVKGLNAGTATIIISCDQIPGLTKEVTVTVRNRPEVVGIEEINADAAEGEIVIYDLRGRRLNRILNTGIYIIDGVKTLVK